MNEKVQLNAKDIIQVCSKYTFESVKSFELADMGEVNSTYIVTLQNKKVVLRVYKERTKEEIQLEYDVLTQLEDLPVTKLYSTIKGNYLLSIKTYNVAVFKFIKGKHVPFTNKHLEKAGCMLGRIHSKLKDFKPSNVQVKTPIGKRKINETLELIKKEYHSVPKRFEKFVQKRVDTTITPELDRVICHGDYHGGNILFHEGEVSGVIDFDDCSYSNKIFDLAGGIFWNCHKENIDFERAKVFVSAYKKHMKLDDKEIAHFKDHLIIYGCLFYLYQNWDKKNWKKTVKAQRFVEELEKRDVNKILKN